MRLVQIYANLMGKISQYVLSLSRYQFSSGESVMVFFDTFGSQTLQGFQKL